MKITKATSKRRLLKLADFLANEVPRSKFEISEWCSGVNGKKLGECGTAACALGWATAIPSFAAKGLRLLKRPRLVFACTDVRAP